MNTIYVLSSCDDWASRDSMRIVGVTTDKETLYAMIAAKIKSGDMEYDGEGKASWDRFQIVFKNRNINLSSLNFGFVETYTDMQIADPDSLGVLSEAAEVYAEMNG